MTPDALRTAAQELRDFVYWAKNESTTIGVYLSSWPFYVDFGDGGEQTVEKDVEDEYYEVDPETVLADAPTSLLTLDETADQLDALADTLEAAKPSLPEMLREMHLSGDERAANLAHAMLGVMQAFEWAEKSAEAVVSVAKSGPQPWPGALQAGIDYTSDDFPQLYMPPPGFRWSNGSWSGCDYDEAEQVEATATGTGVMILDEKGRVSWEERGDADMNEGYRWRVWHEEFEGIPEAMGFHHATPPRAIDKYGYSPDGNWNSPDEAEHVRNMLGGESQEENDEETESSPESFAPPAPVSL